MAGVNGMARRRFVITAGALLATPLAPLTSRAQKQAPRVHRIGYVSLGTPGPQPPRFMQGLRELGYVEGKNLQVERRYSEGQPARLPALVEEMVRSRPDVLVAASTLVTHALMQATSTIPIFFVRSDDPVGYGLVSNLARPLGLEIPRSLLLGAARVIE